MKMVTNNNSKILYSFLIRCLSLLTSVVHLGVFHGITKDKFYNYICTK